jgi:hypothetical protein
VFDSNAVFSTIGPDNLKKVPSVSIPREIPWIIEVDNVDCKVLASIWNEVIARPYLRSIRAVDDGNDLSFMPMLTEPVSLTGSWSLNLVYRAYQKWGDDGSLDVAGNPVHWDPPELLAITPSAIPSGKPIPPSFDANAQFLNAITHGGGPVETAVVVTAQYGWDPAYRDPVSNDPNSVPYAIRQQFPQLGLSFTGRAVQQSAAPPPQAVRMGSLDLDFSAQSEVTTSDPYPSFKMVVIATFGDVIPELTRPARGWCGATPLLESILFTLPRVVIQADQVPLRALRVGGQDPVPDEMLSDDAVDQRAIMGGSAKSPDAEREQEIQKLLLRDPPLVFLPGNDDLLLPSNTQPYLVVLESTATQESRRLSMRIRTMSTAPTAAELVTLAAAAKPTVTPSPPPPAPRPAASAPTPTVTKVYVVDTDPFTVAEISVPQLGAFADDDAAATDGEIANWQTTEIGGASWQLNAAAKGFELRFPAQANGEAMEKGQPWPAVGTDSARGPITIDYRLGPPSRMKLQSAYFQQRYAEAPWNLRRLLGYPGERDAGATVNWLRFELLYGLSGFIWADDMRITELSASIGALPAPLEVEPPYLTDGLKKPATPGTDQYSIVTSHYNQFRETTAQFYGRYRTRLGLYESRQEGGPDPFSISDKIGYLLRLPDTSAPDWKADPDKGQADLRNPLSQNANASGLAGGALWGIESQNILDSIIKQPHAVAGLVSRLSASALGGSGAVKADFADGKSSIKAEVSYGRTETYIVEQIGRIGVFWNVAKHVIVFKRSVLPSDQFAGVQPVEDGRPIGRKVAEYIELLQPRRCYPERGQAQLTRGFVEASNFPVPRIPVDGAWGHDTTTGWAVPLWRSDADPDIYPKPIILVELSAGSDSAAPTIFGRFTDPSQLTFYTSTLDSDSSDTDAWAPVSDIDFENAPAPAPAGTPTIDPSAPDVRLPGDQVRDSLYDRTTFDVDTGGLSADLASGRTGGDRIGAVVATVTMMRAQPRRGGVVAQVQQAVAVAPAASQLATLRSTISGRVSGLLQKVAALDPTMSVASRSSAIAQITADLHDQFAQAKAIAGDQHNQALSGIGQLGQLFKNARDTAASINDAVTSIVAAAKAAQPTLATAKQAVVDSINALQAQAPLTVDQVQSAVFQAHGDLRKVLSGIAIPAAQDGLNLINQFRSPLQDLAATASAAVASSVASINAGCAGIQAQINSANADLVAAQRQLTAMRTTLAQLQADIGSQIDQIRAKAQQSLPAVLYNWNNSNLGSVPPVPASLKTLQVPTFDDILKAAGAITNWQTADQQIRAAVKALATGPSGINDADTAINTALSSVAQVGVQAQGMASQLSNTCEILSQTLTAVLNATGTFTVPIGTPPVSIPMLGTADALEQQIKNAIGGIASPTVANVITAIGPIYDNWAGALTQLPGQATTLATQTVNQAYAFTRDVAQTANDLQDQVSTVISSAQDAIGQLEASAINVLNDGAADIANGLQNYSTQFLSDLNAALPPELDDFQRQLQDGYEQLQGSPTFQDPDGTLRLLRAAGAAPIVPNLSFNKDRLAYFFDDAQAAVQTSPAVALLNRVGDDLKAVGIRVPTTAILDRIIPSSLQNFNFGSLFPDLAGLKLDNLFPGFHLPAIANNNVNVSHGFDQERLEAWAKAEADVPFGQPAQVFAIGPVEISVVGGKLDASIDVSIDTSGKTTRKSAGEIVGDWQIGFGGSPLITFVETVVHFDDQKGLSVNIQPDKVELAPLLDFLTEIIDEFVDPDSGFHLDSERNPATGAFEGIMATIDLPLPPLAAGAFAVSNLRFSSSFGLSTRDDFTLVVSAAIGRQKAPFSLLVAFFTGGGWIEATASYAPSKRKIVASVSIEIVAGVGVDFSFGPCRGFVYIQFGSSATYSTGGPGLSVSVILLIYGGVDILGLLDINLTLMLSITYNGYSVIGRGELDVSIQICWCVTIDVSENITYNLTRNTQSSSGSTSTSSSLDQFG